MNKCINCGREFSATKTTTKYCSNKCRTYFNRNIEKRALTSVAPLTGTVEPPLTGTKCDAKPLTGTAKPGTLKTVNKTYDGKTSFADEEMNKVKAFINRAIAKKIEQGPNHPLNKDKFTKDGAFITYFK